MPEDGHTQILASLGKSRDQRVHPREVRRDQLVFRCLLLKWPCKESEEQLLRVRGLFVAIVLFPILQQEIAFTPQLQTKQGNRRGSILGRSEEHHCLATSVFFTMFIPMTGPPLLMVLTSSLGNTSVYLRICFQALYLTDPYLALCQCHAILISVAIS